MSRSWRSLAVAIAVASGLALTGGTAASAAAQDARGVGPAVAPANDNVASPQILPGTASGSVTGTNVDATEELHEPAHGGSPATASVWFRYIPAATGTVVFKTCGSSFDTTLDVFSGRTIATLKRIVTNDDSCSAQSDLMFTVTAGLTYTIAVDTSTFATGTFTLSWSPPPANDMLAKAIVVTGKTGTAKGDNFGATTEAGEPKPDGDTTKHSVWYSYTPVGAGELTLDTCGSTEDTVLLVYTGATMATLVPVAWDDDGCTPQSRAVMQVQGGVKLQIAVAAYDDSAGPFVLHWSHNPNGVPGKPTVPTVKGGSRWAAVQVVPNAVRGGPTTVYTVTATPGGAKVTLPVGALVAVFTGLTNGTAYKFSAVASNAWGKSAASVLSPAFTPRAVAINVASSWSPSGYATLVQWASSLSKTPPDFQRFSVITMSGAGAPVLSTTAPKETATTTTTVTTTWAVADQAALAAVCNKYHMLPSDAQTTATNAEILVLIWNSH